MTKVFRKGTNAEKIYNTLLTHEYMNPEKIEEKTGIPWTTISGALTKLRRAGLVEYTGTLGSLKWKKHPLKNPLFPPQPDLMNRKTKSGKKKEPIIEVSYERVLQRCVELAADMAIELQRLKKLNPCDQYEEYGTWGDDTVYYKVEK